MSLTAASHKSCHAAIAHNIHIDAIGVDQYLHCFTVTTLAGEHEGGAALVILLVNIRFVSDE